MLYEVITFRTRMRQRLVVVVPASQYKLFLSRAIKKRQQEADVFISKHCYFVASAEDVAAGASAAGASAAGAADAGAAGASAAGVEGAGAACSSFFSQAVRAKATKPAKIRAFFM